MLDGVGNVFKLPTFIVATTNHPEQLMASLSDRPGRFDRFIELLPPSPEERVRLFEFVAKRSATEEEATAIKDKKANGLSAAHITEIVIRHRLTDKSIYVIVKEMLEHSLNVKNNFSINTDIGFNED
jgi:SpoVK/Ycf46/Vps4 family AAA+-type ATPase